MHGRGACVAGGGVCMAGGMCGGGGGGVVGVHSRGGVCMAGEMVHILLEFILVGINLARQTFHHGQTNS